MRRRREFSQQVEAEQPSVLRYSTVPSRLQCHKAAVGCWRRRCILTSQPGAGLPGPISPTSSHLLPDRLFSFLLNFLENNLPPAQIWHSITLTMSLETCSCPLCFCQTAVPLFPHQRVKRRCCFPWMWLHHQSGQKEKTGK